MKIQGRRFALIGSSAVFMLALVIAGCGGGSSDGSSGDPTPPASVSSVGVFANAGNVIVVPVGTSTTFAATNPTTGKVTNYSLDGSASTASSGSALTFAWSFLKKPNLSTVALTGADTAQPEFSPDKAGAYILQLVVSADGVSSARSLTSVVATDTNTTEAAHHLGLSGNCILCHDGDKILHPTIKPRSPGHIATTSMCAACHSSLGFNDILAVDHVEVLGKCSECHDGVKATGKSPWHVETNGECSSSGCHDSTTSWFKLDAQGNFDHSTINRACSTCHNGNAVIGKNEGHIPTNSECNFCHNTFNFKDAFVDHSTPGFKQTQDCASCHVNGNTTGALGYSVKHPDMNIVAGATIVNGGVNCSTCHSVTSFATTNGRFDHGQITPDKVACSTCHIDGPSGTTFAGALSTADFDASHYVSTSKATKHRSITSDCHVCHTTTTFVDGFPEHTANNPDFGDMTKDCARSGCHNGTTALGLPATGHVALINDPNTSNGKEDCVVCHTPPGGTFKTGFFDHTTHTVTGICETCHDGVISTGLDATTHPDTFSVTNCETCHTATNTQSYTTFTGATFDHNIIPGGTTCKSCHNGVKATGYSANHTLATSQDCAICHFSTVKFAPSTFIHTGIDGNPDKCQSCHDGKHKLYTVAKPAGTAIVGKVLSQVGVVTVHIPVSDNCSDCHSDTTVPGGFAAPSTVTNFMTNVHSGYKTGCEGCHQKKFFPDVGTTESLFVKATKGAKLHVPTTQDCYICHKNTASGFAIANSVFTHKGITSKCDTCHTNGATYFASARAQGQPADGALGSDGKVVSYNHSLRGSKDCVACHTTPKTLGASFRPGFIDHTTTAVTAAQYGCKTCHDPAAPYLGNATPKNPGHVVTTDDCILCHTPGGNFANAIFDHSTITVKAGVATPRCDSCHKDGGSGLAKSAKVNPAHVDTKDPVTGVEKDCIVCHGVFSATNTTFAGAHYDHTGIVKNCISCHNGSSAPGQGVNHLPTLKDCVECHTTAAPFTTLTLYNHSQNDPNTTCGTCHNDTIAVGKTKFGTYTHITTAADCGSCHKITGQFLDGGFDHSTITKGTTCKSCHDGANAQVGATTTAAKTNPPHWAWQTTTTPDCVNCHLSPAAPGGGAFAPASWIHDAATSKGNCNVKCHKAASKTDGGATVQPPYNSNPAKGHFQTTAQCDTCHTTSGWTPAGVYKHATGDQYPGTHNKNRIAATECIKCHTTNTEAPQYRTTAYGTTKFICASCHEKNFSSGVGKHRADSAGKKTVAANKDCGGSGGGGCHSVGDNGF